MARRGQVKVFQQTDEVIFWKDAADWIGKVAARTAASSPGSAPFYQSNIYTVQEFALAMNDGSVLCDLLNGLPIGANVSVARPRFGTTLSAFQSKKNITTFLDSCNEALFFDYESMFETDELFLGTRFERVIKTISMVSHTSKAKSLGIP
eukprot:gene17678-30442_t